MTSRFRSRQAGEGKIGCFVTLTILIVAIAAAIKAGPIYYSNNELIGAINSDIGPGASRADSNMPADQLAKNIADQIRKKAKELEVPEAMQPGAVTVSALQSTNDTPGNIHVVLHYGRPVDFYGLYSYTFETDQTLDITIMTNIK